MRARARSAHCARRTPSSAGHTTGLSDPPVALNRAAPAGAGRSRYLAALIKRATNDLTEALQLGAADGLARYIAERPRFADRSPIDFPDPDGSLTAMHIVAREAAAGNQIARAAAAL